MDSHLIPEIKEKLNFLVDIGSCKGDFMRAYKDKFIECFAFEASYENASLINKTIVDEHWENCAVFNLAVCDKTGEVITLHASDCGDSGSNSILGGSTHNKNKQNVFTISIDDIFKLLDIEEIDMLKMDCEGCEYSSLLTSDLSRIKILCMELHRWENVENKFDLLKSHILKTHDVYSSYTNGHEVVTYIRKDLDQMFKSHDKYGQKQ